jgi:hypothetical protein
MSRLHSLDDNCFALATEMVTALSEEFEKEMAGKPTIEELCELLAHGIRGCSADILSNVNAQSITALNAVVDRRKKVIVAPGDVIAVPAKRGGFHFVVFITKNRFGWAFGLLQGWSHAPRVTRTWKAKPVKHPIYSGIDSIVSGRWRIVENRTDLMPMFPSHPEIFYTSALAPEDADPKPGRYGCAISADGRGRRLTKREATEIGLDTNEYDIVFLEEQFEKYLDRHAS